MLKYYCFPAPTGSPTNLTVPRTTTNSLSLTWGPPIFEEQNGIIRYYNIHVDDLTTNTGWDLTTNATRITINNLQPFFTYNCTVAAFTVSLGPISNSAVITLPQDG